MVNIALKVYKSWSLLKNTIFISLCYSIHKFFLVGVTFSDVHVVTDTDYISHEGYHICCFTYGFAMCDLGFFLIKILHFQTKKVACRSERETCTCGIVTEQRNSKSALEYLCGNVVLSHVTKSISYCKYSLDRWMRDIRAGKNCHSISDCDTVVTAEYTAYRASLQSDTQRADGRSVFFVEGEFNETDSLTAAAQTPDPGAFPQLADNRRTALKNYFSFLSERTLPAMTVYRSVAEQWELSFPRDALAEHTIRYLPPEEVSMDHCAVFVRQSDGSWQPVETTSMGSYLLFTAEGENVQLAVLTTAAVWWLWAIFLALIAAAVFFIVRVVHRKRRKKTVKSGKKENGAAG